jgi:hypothetical protein
VVEDGSPKTFEVPPGGADAAGLEDYGVELHGGERIGTMVGSVEEGGRRWLVVETGLPPFKRDRRAIPWSYVPTGDVAGPTDRNTLLFGALASFALGLLTLLAVIALLSRSGDHGFVWAALAVPAVLLLAAGILGYRLWRDPYAPGR